MKNLNLQNVAAVSQQEDGILGHLVWYSISEMFVPRDELRQRLIDAGIGEDYMPRPINGADAFRKASSAVEGKGVIPSWDKSISLNILVRNVTQDKDFVQRNLVLEITDKDNKELQYEPEEAVLLFNKASNNIEVTKSSLKSGPIIDQIKDNFQLFLNNHDSQTIRTICTRYLWSLNPISVRPSGGIYFVPFQHKAGLDKLIAFLKGFGRQTTEGHTVPLINTEEQRDMVKAKIAEHLNNTLTEMAVMLKQPKKIEKGKANILLNNAKFVLENFRDYKEALNDELRNMDFTLDLIQQQMVCLLDRIE